MGLIRAEPAAEQRSLCPLPDCQYWSTGHQSEAAYHRGVEWMRGEEFSQAIPPAYTQFIGELLLDHLALAAAGEVA